METTTTTIETKRCPKCGETKPREMFYRKTSNKDGLQNYCKKCMDAYGKRTTPPHQTQQTETVNTMFADMKPRDIIAEIRERIHYLRSTGWEFTGELKYVEVKTVKL